MKVMETSEPSLERACAMGEKLMSSKELIEPAQSTNGQVFDVVLSLVF